MPWRNVEQVPAGIKAKGVLEISSPTETADESDTVGTGPERPIDRDLDLRGGRTRISNLDTRGAILVLEYEFEAGSKLSDGRELPG